MINIGILLIRTINIFEYIFSLAIVVRCILSWLPINHNNVFSRLIYTFTEPVLGPIRNFMRKTPLGGGMIDFSPIIAWLLISIVANVLTRIILMIVF